MKKLIYILRCLNIIKTNMNNTIFFYIISQINCFHHMSNQHLIKTNVLIVLILCEGKKVQYNVT